MKNNKKENGYSLLEVLLAVSIAIALGGMQLSKVKSDAEKAQAEAVGSQLKMVGGALNSYISLRYAKLTTLSNVAGDGTDTAEDPGPRTCDVAAQICTITSATLVRNGLLPSSFSGRNAYGANYQYFIRISGAAPNWQVEGVALTTAPYTMGAAPRFDLIGQSLLAAGADSGTVHSVPGRIDGFNGGWQDTSFAGVPVALLGGNPNPLDTVGIMAYRAGYGTSGYAAYMRVDGGSQMTGSLDMGTNNITNITNLTASGDVTTGRVVTGARPDAIIMDTSTDGTTIGVSSGIMTIRNNNGLSILDRTTNTPKPLQAGDLAVTNANITGTAAVTGAASVGSLSSASDITSGGNISSNGRVIAGGGASGGFQTADGKFSLTDGNVSLDGTITAGSIVLAGPGAGDGWISTTKGWQNATYGGGWYMDEATTLKVFGNKTVQTEALVANGRITAKQGITIEAEATPGATCGTIPDGSLAVASGRLAQCVGNTWALVGLNTVTATDSPQCSGSSVCEAVCPAGKKIVGGGFYRVNFTSVSDPVSPAQSFPDTTNNKWVIVSGSPTTFVGRAICGD